MFFNNTNLQENIPIYDVEIYKKFVAVKLNIGQMSKAFLENISQIYFNGDIDNWECVEEDFYVSIIIPLIKTDDISLLDTGNTFFQISIFDDTIIGLEDYILSMIRKKTYMTYNLSVKINANEKIQIITKIQNI